MDITFTEILFVGITVIFFAYVLASE